MKKSLFTCCLLMLSLAKLSAQGMQSPAKSSIDSALQALMKQYNITGASIAIVDHNQMVYAHGYGFADLKDSIRTTENTLFGVGSTTKTFTAMAIMKLHEEGKLDLDKPASYYLPELSMRSLVEKGDVLKVRDILSHVAAMPGDFMNNDVCSVDVDYHKVINELNQQVLTQPARWKWNYSNIGFDLLGCIIERVSGMKYTDYIQQNILDKAGMSQSGFFLASTPGKNISKGYTGEPGKVKEKEEPVISDLPAGRLITNSLDISKFMLAILNNGQGEKGMIISPASMKDMETNHISDVKLNIDMKFGYGMFIRDMYYAEDSIIGEGVGHPGDTYIFHATMFTFPKLGLGIAVMCNSHRGSSFCSAAFKKIFSTYMQKERNMKLHPKKDMQYAAKALHNNNFASTKELAGIYGTGSAEFISLIPRGESKIIMKQKGMRFARIILRKDSTGMYATSLRAFGVIHKKIPGQKFAFEKIDGRIYMKDVNDSRKLAEYAVAKDELRDIPKTWLAATGKIVALNSCEGNKGGIPFKLEASGKKLVLHLKFADGIIVQRVFNPISESMAVEDGIDRDSGMVMTIQPDGSLYFSGYKMRKVGS
jgi:CubicO group peptidase (beta-lactamase class C family)